LDVINNTLGSSLEDLLQASSSIFSLAPLGDLHALIVWIVHYQKQLNKIYLPNNGLPHDQDSRYHCIVFEKLPMICEQYVNGNSNRKGAATHLMSQCVEVVSDSLKAPADIIQRHSDGSFFTNIPTDMWTIMNQHLTLAAETQSPILHVMIADIISNSLKRIIKMITEYVQNVDFNDIDLKEIELELLSALANDNALHIEEVISVVNNFEMDEIRHKIDEIYDSVTMALVDCGQACLKRLVNLVMSDIENELAEVFTPDWIEGMQVKIVIATMTDYMADFEKFLMPFWFDKFAAFLMEAIIIRYTRSVVFRKDSPPLPQRKKSAILGTSITGFFGGNSYKGQMNKNNYFNVDAEVLGRLAQDVNALNAFFCLCVGQEKAQEKVGVKQEKILNDRLLKEGKLNNGN
jgi:hypothetical protein